MKATAVEGNNNNSHMGISREGKIHKNKHKEAENEEIKAYLLKLQELVPFMPKNRKLSKLEVIQYVIDYIRDLRQTLGLPLPNSRFAFDLSESMELMSSALSPNSVILPSSRQPLGVISTPNTSSLSGSCGSLEMPALVDKPNADVDTRPVSC